MPGQSIVWPAGETRQERPSGSLFQRLAGIYLTGWQGKNQAVLSEIREALSANPDLKTGFKLVGCLDVAAAGFIGFAVSHLNASNSLFSGIALAAGVLLSGCGSAYVVDELRPELSKALTENRQHRTKLSPRPS